MWRANRHLDWKRSTSVHSLHAWSSIYLYKNDYRRLLRSRIRAQVQEVLSPVQYYRKSIQR